MTKTKSIFYYLVKNTGSNSVESSHISSSVHTVRKNASYIIKCPRGRAGFSCRERAGAGEGVPGCKAKVATGHSDFDCGSSFKALVAFRSHTNNSHKWLSSN